MSRGDAICGDAKYEYNNVFTDDIDIQANNYKII